MNNKNKYKKSGPVSLTWTVYLKYVVKEVLSQNGHDKGESFKVILFHFFFAELFPDIPTVTVVVCKTSARSTFTK